MANRFEVIDADGHITEEDIQLKKYMAENMSSARRLSLREIAGTAP